MDVAASTGGALSILQQYYDNALEDSDNNWLFIVSTPHFNEASNVKVIKFPWVKRNWFYRIFFELFTARVAIRDFSPDVIYNLQNIITLGVTRNQVVYLHQAIPFSTYKMKLFNEPLLWFYQNIYSHFIFYSLRRASQIIVQTEFMKDSCLELLHIPEEKILVVPPKFNYTKPREINRNALEDKSIFFYPAGGPSFKNHKVILDALLLMTDEQLKKIQVVFTLVGDESKIIRRINKVVQQKKLPVVFVGYLDKEKMEDYYSKSVLVFPSVIETFGLPLLEAKQYGSIIFASDSPFSHEILDGYDKVEFFNPFSPSELYKLLASFL